MTAIDLRAHHPEVAGLATAERVVAGSRKFEGRAGARDALS